MRQQKNPHKVWLVRIHSKDEAWDIFLDDAESDIRKPA